MTVRILRQARRALSSFFTSAGPSHHPIAAQQMPFADQLAVASACCFATSNINTQAHPNSGDRNHDPK